MKKSGNPSNVRDSKPVHASQRALAMKVLAWAEAHGLRYSNKRRGVHPKEAVVEHVSACAAKNCDVVLEFYRYVIGRVGCAPYSQEICEVRLSVSLGSNVMDETPGAPGGHPTCYSGHMRVGNQYFELPARADDAPDDGLDNLMSEVRRRYDFYSKAAAEARDHVVRQFFRGEAVPLATLRAEAQLPLTVGELADLKDAYGVWPRKRTPSLLAGRSTKREESAFDEVEHPVERVDADI